MKHKWFLNVMAVVFLVSGLFGVFADSPALAAPAKAGEDKIEALVLEEIASAGQTDFFVWMTEKADLSPAYDLQTKEEKGQFVYDTLVATADRTQRSLRAYLDSQGVDYQSFYIANKILVRGGSLDLLMTIAALPDVAEITANHKFQLQEPMINPDAPEGPEAVESNISFIKADQVWAMGITGAGTVVAGNDTGLYATHPALARHYRGCIDPPTCSSYDHNYNWWDATGTYPNVPNDGHGHGTHTTGTMVGDDGGTNQIGVAPGAQTVHCKNMTDGGSGDDGTFTECFQWDLAPWDLSGANADPLMAPDAINNSWGYFGGGQNQFRDEVLALRAAGVLVEVSSGNEGSSCSTLRSPGDYQEVLTTGSVNHAAPWPGTMTGFSSRGPSSLDGDFFPDITAPGENIRSSIPGGGYQGGWSGTSMAGPHATALVGLMWSACPALAGQVELTIQMIQQTAAPVTSYVGSCGGNYTTGPNNDWGFGTIDALAAVQAALAVCGGVEFGYINGYVYDTNGNPLQGASVSAAIAPEGVGVDAITDPTGFYTMTVMVGTYNVTASKTAYQPVTVNNVVVTTDTITLQDFSLPFLGSWLPGPDISACFDLTRIDAEYYGGTELVYILGGRGGADGSVTDPNIYSFDPVTGNCADTGANMPIGISNYTIALVNNGTNDLLCTFGGRDPSGTNTLAIQCYDPNANTAANVGNLPGAFSGYVPGGLAVVDNMVYVFGGFRNTAAPYELNVTFRYDPVANTFTQIGNLGLARSYLDVAVVDGAIYAFGGTIWDGTNLNAQTYSEVMLDPAGAGAWTQIADLPTATAEGRAFGFNSDSTLGLANKIVIAAGGQWPSETAEALVYDVGADTYDTAFPDLITARRDTAGVFVPIESPNPADGLPAMWVIGGRAGADVPPYADPEYFPLPTDMYAPDINTNPLVLDETVFVDVPETITLTLQNLGGNVLDWELYEMNATLNLVGWTPAPLAGVFDPASVAETVASPDVAAPASMADAPIYRPNPDAVLYDNGPLVTIPGGGFNGADLSGLQTALGMNILGFGHQILNNNHVADDFVISSPAGWTIDTITFYAYQTGSTTDPSTINDYRLQIWDGDPSVPGSLVVFGDMTTNRLLSSAWSGSYRATDAVPGGNTRPIMASVVDVGVYLPQGTYWLEWTAGGTLGSGPWAPPVTILGQTTTGNGLQNLAGTWGAAVDIGQQGFPFVIEGVYGEVFDIPWLSETPTTGSFMGSTPVAVTFDPTGMAAGQYYATLGITSNDPDEPLYTIPVTMTVIEMVAGVDVAPPTDTLSADPGVMVEYTLSVANNGNIEDTFELTYAGNTWDVHLPVTEVTLLPGAAIDFLVHVTIPTTALGGEMDMVTVTATSVFDSLVSDSAELTTYANTIYGFDAAPAALEGYGDPGVMVEYTVQLTNTGNITDTFTFTYTGNTWEVHLPVENVEVGPGATADVIVHVTVPAAALAGDMDMATLTATSTGDPLLTADIDVTTHANAVYDVDLTPATDALEDAPGVTVVYTLQIANLGNITDTFTVSFAGNTWAVSIPVTSFELAVGETANVVVNVTIPVGALDGDFDVVTVTVTSAGDGTVTSASVLTTTAVVAAPTGATIYLPVISK